MTSPELRAELRRRAAFASRPKWRRFIRHPARELFVLSVRALHRVTPLTVRRSARTFWGDRLDVVLPEVVAKSIFRYGFFEEGLSELLLHLLRPGDVYLDIGAHLGYHALLAAALVGERGRVFAFEPTPATYRLLAANTAQRPNITALQQAMHARPGQLTFSDFGAGYSAFNTLGVPLLDEASARRVRPTRRVVEVSTVDAFVAERALVPSFIKIDAEGAEPAILAGMSDTLRVHRPLVTLEVGDVVTGIVPSRERVAAMLQHGYAAYEWRDGTLLPHRIQERYRYTNILFAPSERPLATSDEGGAP